MIKALIYIYLVLGLGVDLAYRHEVAVPYSIGQHLSIIISWSLPLLRGIKL